MSRAKWKNILKRNINKMAYLYLTQIQGKKYKGWEIEYGSFLRTQDYLQPNKYLNLEEQKEIMKIRLKMNKIPFNFSHRNEVIYCRKGCEEAETNSHLYICKNIPNLPYELSYDYIYNGSLQEKVKVYRKLKENLKFFEVDPVIPECDPI